ncbi:MAG: hypothetical protein U0R19_21815 [Bryobacteraceae bacterium]
MYPISGFPEINATIREARADCEIAVKREQHLENSCAGCNTLSLAKE